MELISPNLRRREFDDRSELLADSMSPRSTSGEGELTRRRRIKLAEESPALRWHVGPWGVVSADVVGLSRGSGEIFPPLFAIRAHSCCNKMGGDGESGMFKALLP